LPTVPPDDPQRCRWWREEAPVTYNFDPDRWYDNELAALEHERQSGSLTPPDYETRKDQLLDRYDAMVKRLDGTYRIPDCP
jgi:hypothetical protein